MRSLITTARDLPTAPGSSVPNTNPPKVMMFSPPHCLSQPSVTGAGFPELDELTRWLPGLAKLYGELAIEQDTYFADAAQFCEPDPVDGLHLEVENTRKLGIGIAKTIALGGFANLCETPRQEHALWGMRALLQDLLILTGPLHEVGLEGFYRSSLFLMFGPQIYLRTYF